MSRMGVEFAIAGAVLWLVASGGVGAATYYAAPEGGGDGTSETKPCLLNEGISKLQPGDTLILLDGNYVGDGSMLRVADPVKGTPEAPILIRALHDGKVTIDGEGARFPVQLYQTEYVQVEGINACRSKMTVVSMSRSSHCALKRCCGWDAGDDNTNIFGVHHGDYNLVEDCAGWGIARKTFSCSQNGNYTTFRRCWGRWEGCTNVGPKMMMTVSYNSHHTLAENCIGTWDGRKMPETYVVHNHGEPFTNWGSRPKVAVTMSDYGVDQPYGIFGIDTREGAGVRLLGCIAYRLGEQRTVPYIANYFLQRAEDDWGYMQNCVSFVETGARPARALHTNFVELDHCTAISETESSLGRHTASAVLALEKPEVLVGEGGNILQSENGANVWFRYEDGQLTDKPLWPWPMNERIKELTGVDVTRTVFELGGGTLPEKLAGD
jgi:hypothetical protein